MRGFKPKGDKESVMLPSQRKGKGGLESPRTHQLAAMEDRANRRPQVRETAQLQEKLNAPNATGMSDDLKSGLEGLSGMDLSGVRVHYNSPEPAQLQAHAFTQGQDIHVAPGQERHVPHEGWHVVQQMQGRVQPTTQVAGTDVNDSPALETEADVMGARASRPAPAAQRKAVATPPATVAQARLIIADRDVTSSDINKKGHYKTKLNSVISEEARRAHLAPYEVREELTGMVVDGEDHDYETRRDAVLAAIARLTGVAEAEEELFPVMDDVEAFDDFPRDETWRLLMDGKHQASRGKFGFENEEGYMSAMMAAFQSMLENLGEKLTAVSYEQLHDLAVGGVLDRHGEEMETGYRDNKMMAEGFGVDADTWSLAGYQELRQKYLNRREDPVGANLMLEPEEMVGPDVDRKVMQIKPMARSQCIRFATQVLDLFYETIEQADDEDKKLEAIARCAQDLDQLHLFADGNIRTIAFLVVNKLLIENGLDPVILDEPNVFDCKSVGELKRAIRQGQAKFRSFQS